MSDTAGLLIVATVIVIGFTYFEVKSNKRSIRDTLIEKGATDVTVAWQWAWGDRSNQVYTAEYTNRLGRRCQITCKVGGWGGEIYWSEPLEV